MDDELVGGCGRRASRNFPLLLRKETGHTQLSPPSPVLCFAICCGWGKLQLRSGHCACRQDLWPNHRESLAVRLQGIDAWANPLRLLRGCELRTGKGDPHKGLELSQEQSSLLRF